jgi:flagellar hook-associated protein 3 FlgL
MDRVSTTNSYNVVLSGILRAQQAQNEANTQLSTGKKATDLRGFASDSQTLVAARTVKVQTESYIKLNENLSRKLDTQNLYLTSTADVADTARQAIANAVANNTGSSLMETLKLQFSAAVESLNGQNEGQYLFSGSQTSTKPVSATSLSALTAPATVASIFQNDSEVQTSRLNDATSVTTGLTASDIGTDLMTVFKNIQDYYVANTVTVPGPPSTTTYPFGSTLTPAETTFLNTQMQSFASAHSGLTDRAALNGAIANGVATTITSQKARVDSIDSMTSDLSGINEAETVSRLRLAQQAVQAGAQVFLALKSSSLLNYIN